MLDVLLAFAAGLLTIAAPCVLPMLPIVLGASVGHRDPLRPVLITVGFAVTFSLVAFLFGLFPSVLGLSQDTLRDAAAIMLGMFGVLMLWRRPFDFLMQRLNTTSAVTSRLSAVVTDKSSALLLGASLGAVWAPCAGPVLGSILTLVATSEKLGHAALLLAVYSAGAALPMLVVAYGGQYVSVRIRRLAPYAQSLQRGFGAVVMLIAIAVFFQYDAVVTVWMSRFFPDVAAAGL
jgi:cytochrome c-type biogenesis protein